MDVSDYIAADPVAAETLDRVSTVLLAWEDVERTDQKSQISFSRKHPFAALWVPEQYLRRRTVPVVLSIMARQRIEADRFKEIAEPRPDRFTHHLEVSDPVQIDVEVVNWLRAAWADAG